MSGRRSEPTRSGRQTPEPTFGRALLAFLALPGSAALAAPPFIALLDPWQGPVHWPGAVPMVAGAWVLARCVRDFYVAGRGTLAPWSPPTELVTVGLYRHCRNPMYVGVVALVLGWSWLLGSPAVAAYGLALGLAFHLRVRLHEEPWLARRFPDAWPPYRDAVPRWWPRWQPADPASSNPPAS